LNALQTKKGGPTAALCKKKQVKSSFLRR
jgi:hypothetical protein